MTTLASWPTPDWPGVAHVEAETQELAEEVAHGLAPVGTRVVYREVEEVDVKVPRKRVKGSRSDERVSRGPVSVGEAESGAEASRGSAA